MKYMTCTHTDVGTRKKTNQDSMLVMQASTDRGQVLLASVCDGMGGLAKGEVASCAMVEALQSWFANNLPALIADGLKEDVLFAQWGDLIQRTGDKIAEYGARLNVDLGTTCVVLLVMEGDYYLVNVGDSRIYLIADTIYQLTKDQTYVQREIDEGRLTYEQAANDPNRSVLLQCVGATRVIEPVFYHGKCSPGQVFMLCCDGFRHVISPQEFYDAFNPRRMKNTEIMKQKLEELTRLNIARHEDDNISAILVKTL